MTETQNVTTDSANAGSGHLEGVASKGAPRIGRAYHGMAPDAAWRAEAAVRIDRIRKANLSIMVVDDKGNPLPDADVQIEMTRHAFKFGSAVMLQWIGDLENRSHDVYRQHIARLFNHVVSENDLKWPRWAGVGGTAWWPTWSQERSLAALRWLKARDFHIKGHCIIWPSWQNTIPALRAVADDPHAMRKLIAEHIRDLVTKTGPFIDEWDVINEPFNNNDVMNVLGNEAMIEWFKQTHAYDADARLYLNDFDILASGGGTDPRAHQRHYEETIGYLIDGGAPIGGIGMQSHFLENVTPPATVWSILDRYARFNLPIQITEFDIDIDDEDVQANYTRDFMTAVFAHESIDGFVMWGFWEGRHWRPNGAMFRRDWSIKPNGEQYKRLVFDAWWTREKGRSDASGSINVRGFLGDYAITVSKNGRTIKTTIPLDRPDTAVTIALTS